MAYDETTEWGEVRWEGSHDDLYGAYTGDTRVDPGERAVFGTGYQVKWSMDVPTKSFRMQVISDDQVPVTPYSSEWYWILGFMIQEAKLQDEETMEDKD